MAQKFITKGSIVYERKVQLHKLLEGNDWAKDFVTKGPKFYISNFELLFSRDTTTYLPMEEDERQPGGRFVPCRQNEVYSFLPSATTTVRKKIWDDTYLISDSAKTYQWKMVNETRKIAGVDCRKATTIIYDSIFVVAFYAETLPLSAGPEQFGGLPGVILGLVIPKMHVSYYATKISENSKTEIQIPKSKFKNISRNEYENILKKNMQWMFKKPDLLSLYYLL